MTLLAWSSMTWKKKLFIMSVFWRLFDDDVDECCIKFIVSKNVFAITKIKSILSLTAIKTEKLVKRKLR